MYTDTNIFYIILDIILTAVIYSIVPALITVISPKRRLRSYFLLCYSLNILISIGLFIGLSATSASSVDSIYNSNITTVLPISSRYNMAPYLLWTSIWISVFKKHLEAPKKEISLKDIPKLNFNELKDVPEEVLITFKKHRGDRQRLTMLAKEYVKAGVIPLEYAPALIDEFMKPEKVVHADESKGHKEEYKTSIDMGAEKKPKAKNPSTKLDTKTVLIAAVSTLSVISIVLAIFLFDSPSEDDLRASYEDGYQKGYDVAVGDITDVLVKLESNSSPEDENTTSAPAIPSPVPSGLPALQAYVDAINSGMTHEQAMQKVYGTPTPTPQLSPAEQRQAEARERLQNWGDPSNPAPQRELSYSELREEWSEQWDGGKSHTPIAQDSSYDTGYEDGYEDGFMDGFELAASDTRDDPQYYTYEDAYDDAYEDAYEAAYEAAREDVIYDLEGGYLD